MLKRKTLQILTIVAAVVLLSAYVVYSQLKQSGTVASSSKSLVLTNRGGVEKTNSNTATKVATNSNSAIRTISSGATNSSSPGKKSDLFFPGSKSSAVFVPQHQASK
jgi:hypothetical protein